MFFITQQGHSKGLPGMATASKGPLGSLLFELKFWVRYLLPTRYVAGEAQTLFETEGVHASSARVFACMLCFPALLTCCCSRRLMHSLMGPL